MILRFARRTALAVLAFAAFASVSGQSAQQLQQMGIITAGGGGLPSSMGMGQPAGAGLQGAGMGLPMRSGSSAMGAGSSVPGAATINPSLLNLQPGAVLPSDNSIDENEYIIGAGDVFFAAAVDMPSVRFTAAVDQSGKAYLPNAGMLDIGKVSYADAKKKLAEHIASMLKNPSEIYVALVQTKPAIVSVTGLVMYPGSHEFSGTTRLLDAILAVNGGIQPALSEADLRQVQLVRGDSVFHYDMFAYLHKDDRSQNPYLYPGDRIRINPVTNKVIISGAIKSPAPGAYPIKKDETLGDFLTLFTIDNVADMDNVIIYKSVDNTKINVSRDEMGIILNDLDAITIPIKKNHPGIHTASITGEVASPGHYPIVENVTTARQLIDMAGGMKETGHVDQIVVIRPSKNLPEHFTAIAPQMNVVRPERGASVSMATASLDYTVIRLILYNADKVILEPGDRIHISKRDRFVYISGAVKSPGAYPFLMGKDYNYYVKQAGGYANNADKTNVQVYLKYGDVVQGIEPQCVEAGSVIVVPSSTQYRLLSQVVLPIISTVASIVMVGLALYNVR